MTDRYEGSSTGLTAPATHGFAIIPTDAAGLPEVTRGVYVGGSGDVRLVLRSGAEIVLRAVPSGTVLPLRASAVRATGTSATDLVGLV